MSLFPALWQAQKEAFAKARTAYRLYRRTEYRRPYLSDRTLDRLSLAADRAQYLEHDLRMDLDQAWDKYSRLLVPLPILSDAEACLYDLSFDDTDDFMLDLGQVDDPHGYHRAGSIDSRAFIAWVTHSLLGNGICEGRNE
jgi:hypothetical protein